MKKSLSILALALLLSACDKAEQSAPMSSSDETPKSSVQTNTQNEQAQTVNNEITPPQTQTAKSNESSVIDKLISMTGGDKTEMIKKSTQITDIWALQTAMSKSGIKPDDGVKWQMRVAQAQNEQEVKAILNEQIAKMTITANELEKVRLQDPQVIAIKDGLKKGIEIILNAENKFIAMDFNDPNLDSKLAPIAQDMLYGGQIMMKANDDFLKLVNSLGFKTNEEAKQYYEHYKSQFEQFKHNAQ